MLHNTHLDAAQWPVPTNIDLARSGNFAHHVNIPGQAPFVFLGQLPCAHVPVVWVHIPFCHHVMLPSNRRASCKGPQKQSTAQQLRSMQAAVG